MSETKTRLLTDKDEYTEIPRKEYKNSTRAIAFLTVKDKPFKLKPGKSVWLSEQEFNYYRYEIEDTRFISGGIRPAGEVTPSIKDLDVRNDMTIKEIEVLVKESKDAKVLGNKIKRITGFSTVATILEEVKKQDKSYSFIETCHRKFDSIRKDEIEEHKAQLKDE